MRRAGRPTFPAALDYLLSQEGGTSGSRSRDVAIKLARLYERDRWRYSPLRRLSSVDRIPLDRPIFILGVQGAGETLVGRCLRRNRAVVSMSGNSDHWTGIDELGVVRNRMARLPRSLWGCKHRTDLEHPLFGSNHNSVYASDALLPLYRRTAEDADEDEGRRFRRLLREHVAVYAHDPWSARFLDKTHTNTLRMPLLGTYLRDAQPLFVLVVRNPWSWCHRAVQRKPPSYRVNLSRANQLRLAAEHWANSYATALADGAQVGNMLTLRFEDFVSDPDATVRTLSAFLGLEFEPAQVPQPGQPFPFATLPGDRKWHPLFPDPWLAQVDDREADIVERECASLARRFGYSADGVQTEARRRAATPSACGPAPDATP